MTNETELLPCDVCDGYFYELIGCCSGHECGCIGKPVDSKPCHKCNSDGKKEPSLQARKDWPWFFLTRVEWDRYVRTREPIKSRAYKIDLSGQQQTLNKPK